MYVLRFNQSRLCRDKRPDRRLAPLGKDAARQHPRLGIYPTVHQQRFNKKSEQSHVLIDSKRVDNTQKISNPVTQKGTNPKSPKPTPSDFVHQYLFYSSSIRDSLLMHASLIWGIIPLFIGGVPIKIRTKPRIDWLQKSCQHLEKFQTQYHWKGQTLNPLCQPLRILCTSIIYIGDRDLS